MDAASRLPIGACGHSTPLPFRSGTKIAQGASSGFAGGDDLAAARVRVRVRVARRLRRTKPRQAKDDAKIAKVVGSGTVSSEMTISPGPASSPEISTGSKAAGAMAELPPEQRELIREAFYEDRSHRQIADATGMPLGTVKSRLRLAMAKLKLRLDGDDFGKEG